MSKLYAISDVHVRYEENQRILEALPSCPDDWLIVAGDVGETQQHMEYAFDLLQSRFQRLLWVPGNHELWVLPDEADGPRGSARYEWLVELCRRRGVLTPEDPFALWEGDGGPCWLAPLFVGYDYTFRPFHVAGDEAIAWARQSGILCSDEQLLPYDPFPSRQAWCEQRVRISEERLGALTDGTPTVLVNHFPLRYDLVRLPRIPRFSIWCGTRLTEDWHQRFHAKVVVSGHLHIRRTDYRDGVRFEEVSLGYPRDRRKHIPPASYLREILPGPPG